MDAIVADIDDTIIDTERRRHSAWYHVPGETSLAGSRVQRSHWRFSGNMHSQTRKFGKIFGCSLSASKKVELIYLSLTDLFPMLQMLFGIGAETTN